MVGWIILAVFVCLIVTILCLRVRLWVCFGEELRVTAAVGLVTMQLVPPPEQKEKKPAKKVKTTGEKPQKKTLEKPKLQISLADVREGLHAIWQAIQGTLRRAGQRIRLDPLELNCVFGSENPVDTAQWYGWASAAMWTVMPRLEQMVHVPDPHIRLGMDFNAVENQISGQIGIRCRIGDLLAVGFAAAGPLLRFALPFLRKQKAAKKTAAKERASEKGKESAAHEAA